MQAHACAYTLTCAKLQKLACVHTVVLNFSIRMQASEHMQHATYVHHKLALGLPHYICNSLAEFAFVHRMTPLYMNMFIEFIPLYLAYNLHACQNSCNPNLACAFLTCTLASANYHLHVWCVDESS